MKSERDRIRSRSFFVLTCLRPDGIFSTRTLAVLNGIIGAGGELIVASIGCPHVRFHDLRHSYAVASIRAGDDIKTVQGNLGHATAAFTLDVYGHVTKQMKQASADRMENFIKGVLKL